MIRKLRKGFTIVELVIVIAVIAVLTAVLIPTFVHLSKKANKASDSSLVANLNTALAMEASESGKAPKTMHEAVEGLVNQGYSVPQLVTKSSEDLVYSIADNKFYLSDADEVKNASKKADFWKIYNSVPAASEQTYSIYAGPTFEATEVEVKVGFDAGYKTGISSVSFIGGNDVIIRTNGGNLTVNAPSSKVYHYGQASVVDVQKIDTSSYYENGKTTFIKLAQGRVVVGDDEKVEVGGIYVEANNVIVAVENNKELPDVYIATEVTSFKLQTTNDEGAKQTESAVTVGDAITTAATAESTAVPVAVSVKVERDASKKSEVVKTEEEASEKAASEVAPLGVARIGTTGFATLDEAVSALQNGQTVVLLADDIERASGITFAEGNKALDLNGHQLLVTLPANRNAIKVNAGCEFTLKDSSEEKSGKIVANRSAAGKVCALSVSGIANIYGGDLYGYCCLDMENDSIVNLFGGVLSCDSGNAPVNIGGQNTALNISGGIINSNYRYAIASNDKAAINISGGTINLSYSTNVKAAIKITNDSSLTLSGDATITAPRLIEFANTTANTQVSILGGNYSASIELHKGGDYSDNRDKATVTINGGTFNIEPSISCFKSGSTIGTVTDNGDGTWTVSAD